MKKENSVQASELRLGNRLKWYDGMTNEWRLVEVTTIWRNGFYAAGEIHPPDDSTYEPVPLTPEILEMCGFKKFTNHKSHLHTEISRDAVLVCCHGDFNNWKFSNSKNDIRLNPVKYLHQLQNLFFSLTGTELTINFPSHYKITGQINLPTTDEYFKNEKE